VEARPQQGEALAQSRRHEKLQPACEKMCRQTTYTAKMRTSRFRHGEPSMKITAIKAWQVDLPLVEGRYSWSNGNFVEVFDTTVVAVETDAGLTGYAECCPLGS